MKLNIPKYNPRTHYLRVADSQYFRELTKLRHYIKIATDKYWSETQGAYNVDLFMITPSISSPMGPSSDSEAISIKFGDLKTFLVDSAQFGLEPVLMNGFDKVYCYLPSMRGENPDEKHLNQFYHCEAEIRGQIDDLIPLVEKYIKILVKTIKDLPDIVEKLALDDKATRTSIEAVLKAQKFPRITFDEAVGLLEENGFGRLVNYTKHGRDLKSNSEIILSQLLRYKTPFWIYGYDRDRVPFYQKPDPKDSEKVLNADLIFPPLFEGAFGGEIIGCGQRQDNKKEILESLFRQNISTDSYEWYIHLRDLANYSGTSGFGLGIERFITWILGQNNIRDAILYPRLKNIRTYP
ncbi:MAG: hypothetical protein A3E36_00630 [Candidatus Andersenbacteria bacterium RIFCSPHIGHO2_12_FULL_45_11b]|uniref:Aminoacyl-transfer RNA synthetases class-II family profile domain-containing protein n=1 Tax=Candidatus Andersenbacteria bacterium RIFCSPHIGHO2_12_FULL_45_11b TaxID=1797282 RepID=A0A1G1X569_9BACT|nr:MAG: hypothetical protein A3E36_00630 [Candidatus Andersenbacteria bacterium RIFCSPHIGHO2_12_FULL_45_11b]